MTSPLFSIVTVTLNCAEDAASTAESVLAQDFADYEYLVKDGNSTDGTVQELQSLGVRNIHVMADRGIYDAMNQALTLCTGQYVLFLNAGDIFSSEGVLEEITSYLSDNSGSPDLIYFDYLDVQAGYVVISPDRLSGFYLYRRWLCHQVCFFRLDCYHRYGDFDTTLRVTADYDFLTRVVITNKGSYLHVPIVGIRYKGGGFSSMSRTLFEADATVVRRRRFSRLQRSMFAVIYSLTLPSLRNALFRHRALRWALPFYVRMVNLLGLSYSQPDKLSGEKN